MGPKADPPADAAGSEAGTAKATGSDTAASTDRSAGKKAAVKKGTANKTRRKKTAAKKGATQKGATQKGAAQKTAAKKGAGKKTAAKKGAGKKTAAKKGAGKKTAGKRAAGDAVPGPRIAAESTPHARSTPRTSDPTPRPRRSRGIVDGAAARRASRATGSLGEPQRADALADAGPSLDPGPGERRDVGSWGDELRRIERQVVRRLRGQVEPAAGAGGQASLLDALGHLTDPGVHRRWISAALMRSRSSVVDDFGHDPVYAERWRPLLDFLYRSYWRVETTGMENLPDHGRAVIVSNHSGTLPYDGAMIMYAVRFGHPAHRHVRPLVEDFVFHFPFLGVALNRIGCVRACQENAERLLRDDQVVAVFPEGIKGIGKLYRKRYQLQRFGRGGFIKLALKTRTPIIPTAVVGAEEIYPMLTKVTWLASYLGIPYIPVTPTFPWLGPAGAIPMPSKWAIRFGEPIDLTTQHRPEAHNDRILVNRLTEQVRSNIQALVDETLLTRRSIVFG